MSKLVSVVLYFHRHNTEGEQKVSIDNVNRVQIHTNEYGFRKISIHRNDDVSTFFETESYRLVRMSKYFK